MRRVAPRSYNRGLRVESLEQRRLLAADVKLVDNPHDTIASDVAPLLATVACARAVELDLQFEKVKPFGSLVSRTMADLPRTFDQARTVSFFAEQGSTITFEVRPSGQQYLSLTLRDAITGDPVGPSVVAIDEEEPVEIPSTKIPAHGDYHLEITASRCKCV